MTEPRRPLLSYFTVVVILSAAVSALAAPPADRLAAREAARQAFIASGRQSPTVVVDGTPRPIPDAPVTVGAGTPPIHPLGALERSMLPQADANQSPRTRTPNSLLTTTDEAGMAVDLGGDDIVIASSVSFSGSAYLQITNDGRYFGAVAAAGDVYVYRSLDKGETWTLWSTFHDPAGFVGLLYQFTIAEGNTNRAMFAYSSAGEVRLAYADINAAVPTWTIVTVLSDAGINHGLFQRIDIATDASVYSAYYVYLVAESDDGDGDDIWFARSVNMGTSFEAGYRIASSGVAPYDGREQPSIDFGFGDYLHVSYGSDYTGSRDASYRRADMWADAGISAWEPEQTLETQQPSGYAVPLRVGASTSDGHVYIPLFRTTTLLPLMRFSTDSGATWPAGDQVLFAYFPEGSGMTPVELPGGDLIMGGTQSVSLGGGNFNMNIVMSRSTVADPTVWSSPESFSYHPWIGFNYDRLESMLPDPAFGDRIATLWVQTTTPQKKLRFDAEWRRDPGYPNTDVGFPVAVPGGGQTQPAVAEVDGDPEKEIVFAASDGDVFVYNHDGTIVSGWPQNIGTQPSTDTGVAVGDLVGNGVPSIVVGSFDGKVFAFDPHGNLLPGWPVTMNEADRVSVSIGALGPPNPRYVVATCGHELRAIRYDGTNVSPAWGTFTERIVTPAAIGDVDNDGVTDIVTVEDHWFHVHNLTTGSPIAYRNFPADLMYDAPTMADIDGDGDLEIAVPTQSGKMYLLNHDGTDVPGWPVTLPGATALTSVAWGQILGTSEPELVFGEVGTGKVHVFYATGVEQTGYPVTTPPFPTLYTAPMLSPVSISVSNVLLGKRSAADSGDVRSWRNIPSIAVPGWPKNMPDWIEETMASGDIDNDGRNELVVLGINFLTVLDVGIGPATNPRNHWPMNGYDAQRTGCLACGEILTGVGNTPAPTFATSLDVHPNPFNPATTIEYEVASAGPVTLQIFDAAGRRVATLLDGEYRSAGRYSLTYNATGASGVYFARLRTTRGNVTRKIVLLK